MKINGFDLSKLPRVPDPDPHSAGDLMRAASEAAESSLARFLPITPATILERASRDLASFGPSASARALAACLDGGSTAIMEEMRREQAFLKSATTFVGSPLDSLARSLASVTSDCLASAVAQLSGESFASSISKLAGSDLVSEIAKLAGGDLVSEVATRTNVGLAAGSALSLFGEGDRSSSIVARPPRVPDFLPPPVVPSPYAALRGEIEDLADAQDDAIEAQHETSAEVKALQARVRALEKALQARERESESRCEERHTQVMRLLLVILRQLRKDDGDE